MSMPSPNPVTNPPAKRLPSPSLEAWALGKVIIYQLNKYKPMFEKLKSRKLWAAVIGGAVSAFGGALGLDETTVQHIVTVLVGYIVGQGIADINKPQL